MMKETLNKADVRSTINNGLASVVDHLRLMGVIARESLTHPRTPTTIIYDSQTREIKVSTPPQQTS